MILLMLVLSQTPDDAAGHLARGRAFAARREHAKALAEFNRVLKLRPDAVAALDLRGDALFKLGRIKEAIKSYEKYLKARPGDYSKHWRYGIALYYAGRYADGAKQFQAGEVHFGADVENVFWHYLCNAKRLGIKKARAAMLKIQPGRPDRRVPMMEVYQLIRGKSTPAKVLAKARGPELPDGGLREREFYAHLYVGLNYAALGDQKNALSHMKKADALKIGHYMWDVAHVDLARRKNDGR